MRGSGSQSGIGQGILERPEGAEIVRIVREKGEKGDIITCGQEEN